MKVKVMDDRCIGCGQCEAVCSDVFQIGDEGYAEVVTDNFKEELIDDIKMAASGCPTDAIIIEECNCGCNEEKECDCKHCNCDENK